MSVSIRFIRFGRKGLPFYRLVVVDSRASRDSRYIDCLGHYDPMKEKIDFESALNKEKVKLWFSRGAQPTHSAKRFLSRSGFLQENEVEKLKNPKKKQNKRKKRYTPVSVMVERKAKLKELAEAREVAKKNATENKKKVAEKESQVADEEKVVAVSAEGTPDEGSHQAVSDNGEKKE